MQSKFIENQKSHDQSHRNTECKFLQFNVLSQTSFNCHKAITYSNSGYFRMWHPPCSVQVNANWGAALPTRSRQGQEEEKA